MMNKREAKEKIWAIVDNQIPWDTIYHTIEHSTLNEKDKQQMKDATQIVMQEIRVKHPYGYFYLEQKEENDNR